MIPAFWRTEKPRAASATSKSKKPAASAAADAKPSNLLGLFCSNECVTTYSRQIDQLIAADNRQRAMAAAVAAAGSGSAPPPPPAASNIGEGNRIYTPYRSWKEIPNLTEFDKLLKPIVSRDKYERLFRGLKLSFGTIKAEGCGRCSEFMAAAAQSDPNNKILYTEHSTRGKRGYDMLEFDRQLAARSWTPGTTTTAPLSAVDTIEIGFQSNRPVPQFNSQATAQPAAAAAAAALAAAHQSMFVGRSSAASPTLARMSSGGAGVASAAGGTFVPSPIDDSIFFRRQLWAHVYSVYSSSTSTCYNYVWDERDGKRAINEMLSVLWRHIQDNTLISPSSSSISAADRSGSGGRHVQAASPTAAVAAASLSALASGGAGLLSPPAPTAAPSEPKRAPWLIAFGEGCKNFYSLCFFAELTREDSPFSCYRRIDYKVLEPGHSYLSTDRCLSGIEREVAKHTAGSATTTGSGGSGVGTGTGTGIFSAADWCDVIKGLSGRKSTSIGNAGSVAASKIGTQSRVEAKLMGGGVRSAQAQPPQVAASGNAMSDVDGSNSTGAASAQSVVPPTPLNGFYDWKSLLAKNYSKARLGTDINGVPIDLSRAVWFNFGVGEDRTPPTAPAGSSRTGKSDAAAGAAASTTAVVSYHPDQVWIRYSLDEFEPWKKVFLSWGRAADAPPQILKPLYTHVISLLARFHHMLRFSFFSVVICCVLVVSIAAAPSSPQTARCDRAASISA